MLNKHYSLDGTSYVLGGISNDITELGRIREINLKNNIAINYLIKVPVYQFEKILKKIAEEDSRDFIQNAYEKRKSHYYLAVNWEEAEKIREVFMFLNKDNEMHTGISEYGVPMPHNFPRVFEAKSKAHFDIHFAWGVKFDDLILNDQKLGNFVLGFSVNLTNFVMPSLEFLFKYNFHIEEYPLVEPYVGAALYGGFLDGFPVGINALAGVDVFPAYYEPVAHNRNFYLSGELRMGAVLYAPIYFDTGLNNEGIWKKFEWLAEGGFYVGAGYLWN